MTGFAEPSDPSDRATCADLGLTEPQPEPCPLLTAAERAADERAWASRQTHASLIHATGLSGLLAQLATELDHYRQMAQEASALAAESERALQEMRGRYNAATTEAAQDKEYIKLLETRGESQEERIREYQAGAKLMSTALDELGAPKGKNHVDRVRKLVAALNQPDTGKVVQHPAVALAEQYDDRLTLAYLRAAWPLWDDERRTKWLRSLVEDLVRPWHQRGSAWQGIVMTVPGGVGITPAQASSMTAPKAG